MIPMEEASLGVNSVKLKAEKWRKLQDRSWSGYDDFCPDIYRLGDGNPATLFLEGIVSDRFDGGKSVAYFQGEAGSLDDLLKKHLDLEEAVSCSAQDPELEM